MKFILLALLLSAVVGCQVQRAQSPLDFEAIRLGKNVLEAGHEHFKRGDLALAARSYTLAYDLGQEAAALAALGCIAAREGNDELALKHFRAALEFDPMMSAAYGHIAAVLELRGEVAQAEQFFIDGLAVKAGDIPLRYEYAQFLKRRSRLEESKILSAQVSSMIPKPITFSLKGR